MTAEQRFGSYRLLDDLGRGAMATVYRAQAPSGAEVALKILHSADPKSVERFRREGEITAALTHPGIIRIHDGGVVQGQAYLCYELVEGGELAELVRRGAPPSGALLERILDAVEQTARAVGYAHGHGIVHRDLKPENVLLDAMGQARVADFGVAMCASHDRLTRTGAVVGTPHYMAPEQLEGERELTPQADVWALGVILYEALTGQLPFDGSSLTEVMAKVLNGKPTRPSRLGCDPRYDALCARALARDPAARFPNGAAFADALRSTREGAPARRGPPFVALLAGALALVGAGLLAAFGLDPGPPTTTPEAPPAPPPEDPSRVDPTRQAKLERALQEAQTGDLQQALDGLRLLEPAPTVDELQPVLEALTQLGLATLRAGKSSDATADAVRRVAALVEFLPREAGRQYPSALAAGLAQRVARAQAMTGEEERLLDALASCGGRVEDPGLALATAAAIYLFTNFGEAGEFEAQKPRRLLGLRLDLPTDYFSLKELRAALGGVPQGSGPWERFARVRCQLESRANFEAMRELLERPPPDLHLGPVQWSEAAAKLKAEPEVRARLLEEALRRCPDSVVALVGFSKLQADLGDERAALALAERAEETMHRLDYASHVLTRIKCGQRLRELVSLYAELGARERARATLAKVRAIPGYRESEKLVRRYPWLEEDESR